MYSNLIHFTSEARDKELKTIAHEICKILSKKSINIHEALYLLKEAEIMIKYARIENFIFPGSSNTG